MSSIERLLSLSSDPLLPSAADERILPDGTEELLGLLRLRNGVYAFESALHILPLGHSPTVMCVEEWNSHRLWRSCYGRAVEGEFFFAEDVFGGQFSLVKREVRYFDPELGSVQGIAPSLEDWATAVLRDYATITGWPLAHEWQVRNGSLTPGRRLIPIIPFLAGGEYALSNLMEVEAAEGMRIRCDFWRQTAGLAPGTTLRPSFPQRPSHTG